ncbi:MAG: MFS transporter [Burkholderiales bacterium]|nr:MFS transporter [Burkholderiales bacterium]MBK8665483.1 MFS transporter [Burkholderiales bacterium]
MTNPTYRLTGTDTYPSNSQAVYLLGMLIIAGILSFVDRQILALLVQPIRADLGISDTEISLLQGFAFAVFYVFLGFPLGRYADRANRRNLIVAGIAVSVQSIHLDAYPLP